MTGNDTAIQSSLTCWILLLVAFLPSVHAFGCFAAVWEFQSIRTEIFFPLRSMAVDVFIIDGVSQVSLTQIFETKTNNFIPVDVSTRYFIPIPSNAAIHTFVARYDDRVIEGVVETKDDAQQIFDDAVDSGKPAFLGEQPSDDLFKLEFGYVPLNRIVEVELVFVAEIDVVSRNLMRFVFPSSLAPEMNPVVGNNVPDDLPFDNGALTLTAQVFSSVGSIAVSSPSHTNLVLEADLPNNGKQVHLVDTETDRRDIVLLLETTNLQDSAVTVFTESSLTEDGTTTMMLSVLPDLSTFGLTATKSFEIFIILDATAIMLDDGKWEQQATAAKYLLQNLPAGSTYNFGYFLFQAHFQFHDGSRPLSNTTAVQETLNLIDSIEPSAATNLLTILFLFLTIQDTLPATAGQERIVFFFTGNQEDLDANRDFETLLSNFLVSNRGDLRVFPMAVGDANNGFIRRLARAGGGLPAFLDSTETSDIEATVADQLETATGAGFLSNVTVEWLGGDAASSRVVPYLHNVMYANKRSLLFYQQTTASTPPPTEVRITALAGGQLEVRLEIPSTDFISLDSLGVPVKVLSKMAARVAIQDLEELRSELHVGGMWDQTEVVAEIQSIGTTYNITSSETSFIAVDNMDWTSINEAGKDDDTTDNGEGGGGPAPEPAPAPTSNFCFSGSNTVLVAGKGYIALQDLKIGDYVVQTDAVSLDRVYSFGHYNVDAMALYVQIYTNDKTTPLELSADHMVYVMVNNNNKNQHQQGREVAVTAGTVAVGDLLVSSSSTSAVIVTKISTVQRLGAYAPFTESGTIVVNGIKASSYVSLQPNHSSHFQIGTVPVVSMQWMAHTFQAPHRILCKLSQNQLCQSERYTEHDGISLWVYAPWVVCTWMLRQHVLVLGVLSVPLLVLAVALWILEVVLEHLMMLLWLGALLFVTWSRHHRTNKKA